MALLNPCMKFKNSFVQKTSFEDDIYKKYLWHVPGSTKSRIVNWDFLKKDSQDFKILFSLVSYEYLASLESKTRSYPFFDIHNRKKSSVPTYFCSIVNGKAMLDAFLSAFEQKAQMMPMGPKFNLQVHIVFWREKKYFHTIFWYL